MVATGELVGGQFKITADDGSTHTVGKEDTFKADVQIAGPDGNEYTVKKGTKFNDTIVEIQKNLQATITEDVGPDLKEDCRFYENVYPEPETLVMVNVKQIAEMGAYVQLLEYGNIEGMILLSELSRRRIRSINKLIRVGKNEVVMVLRVDKEKGYIDLSKRRVSQEEAAECEEKYNKSKMVHSVLRHVAEAQGADLISLYEKFAWPLYKRFPHVFDAFRVAIVEPDKVFGGMDIDEQGKKLLLQQIKRKLTPHPIKIRTDIEVQCFTYEGIDAIKAALTAGKTMSTEDVPIEIRLIAPPLYVMTTQTLEKELGLELLKEATSKVQAMIEESGGQLTVKTVPTICSTRDDQELENMLAHAEREMAQVDGDDPEED
jgi:translation initiation factor 2 subunit 1